MRRPLGCDPNISERHFPPRRWTRSYEPPLDDGDGIEFPEPEQDRSAGHNQNRDRDRDGVAIGAKVIDVERVGMGLDEKGADDDHESECADNSENPTKDHNRNILQKGTADEPRLRVPNSLKEPEFNQSLPLIDIDEHRHHEGDDDYEEPDHDVDDLEKSFEHVLGVLVDLGEREQLGPLTFKSFLGPCVQLRLLSPILCKYHGQVNRWEVIETLVL